MEHKNLIDADLHEIGYSQSGDPGAIGAFKVWIDTTTATAFQVKIRNAANTAWEVAAIVPRSSGNVALANGANQNLSIDANTLYLTFTGGGASATLGGLTGGYDGRRLYVFNDTGSNVTHNHDDAGSTAANRLYIGGAANRVQSNLATLEYIYHPGKSRWCLVE